MSPMPLTLLNQKQHPRAMMNPLESRFQNLVRTRQRACGIEKVPLLGDESYETFSLSAHAGVYSRGKCTICGVALASRSRLGLKRWIARDLCCGDGFSILERRKRRPMIPPKWRGSS